MINNDDSLLTRIKEDLCALISMTNELYGNISLIKDSEELSEANGKTS